MAVQAAVRALPARIVSQVTGADLRSVERWRSGTRPRRAKYVQRLDDLDAVLELLGPRMTAAGRRAWLTSRSAHLGWKRPIDVLADGDFDRVAGAARAYAAGDAT